MSLTAILSTQALAIGARVFAPAATNAFRSRMASRRSTRALYAEADAPALCSARIGRVTGLARELGDRVGGGQNPVWQRGDEGPRKFCERFWRYGSVTATMFWPCAKLGNTQVSGQDRG
jgi:hypothetical protein